MPPLPDSRAAASLERLRALQDASTRSRVATMELVKAKRLKTARDLDLTKRVNELLENLTTKFDPKRPESLDNRIEARGLLVLGETGAGKSWTLRRHFAKHPAFPDYDLRGSDCPLVTVNVKPPMTFLALGKRIAAKAGYPIKGRMEAHAIWDLVYERLEFRGIFALHLDELHNFVLTANAKDLVDTQNAIKSLMTNLDWPVVVIVSGLPLLKEFIEGACEDRRRLKVIHFERLKSPVDNKKIAAMLRSTTKVAALHLEETTVQFVVPRLMHAALYALGTTMELIHEAIEDTLRGTDGELTSTAFSNAYVARTSCLSDADPFVADNWADLDCTKVLMRDADVSILPKAQAMEES